MKKTLLLSFTMLACSLFGQNKIESSIYEKHHGSSYETIRGKNYEYDSNDNLIKETNYDWVGNSWAKNYILFFTYDNDNKVTLKKRKGWNGIVQQYLDGSKTEYTYNANGLPTQFLDIMMNTSGQYVVSGKTEFTYNGTKLATSLLSHYNGNQWYLKEKSTLTYIGNRLNQVIIEDHNGTDWELSWRILFSYNSNNQISSVISESFDGTGYVEYEKVNYDFDNNLNLLNEISFEEGYFDFDSQYNYDFTAQLSDYQHPFKDKTGIDYIFETFPYVSKILNNTTYGFDTQTNSAYIIDRVRYDYTDSLFLSTKSNMEIQNINLYPNPANEYIQISGITNSENVAVYTVLGVKAFDTVTNEGDKINIEGLSKGLYLLKFENGVALKFLKK
ncbi:T9SS type A sorting domain-containing protein [Brumimicrobium glaciale]|uniref:T9SS type A sorting domain-containing protein n=1 Tax=Brumimicrobium glaciale TaxID=200475 RepID=A0A4Q4KMG6_9FLAO|nr:T9SS type A sorting domain-containing protein [Brumimicrobium glaciale]RYM34581.1 T9SS type A sorting domain-containing protein [Brumimicrobium glaciale]